MDNNDLLFDKNVVIKPDATAAEIDELLKTADSEVKKAIALHPNTSPETLIELCKDYSDRYLYCAEVLHNPALNLILLECTDFLDRLHSESSSFLNHLAKLPEFIVDWAVNHSQMSVRLKIARNHYVEIDCLEKLARDINIYVRISVATTVCMSDRDFQQLYKIKTTDRTVNLYRDRALKIICQLAEDKYKDVRSAVAKNTGTPIFILEQLSLDLDKQVLSAVARNSQTPEAIVRNLFQEDIKSLSKYKLVARSVAMNRNIPMDLMEMCANSEDSQLRFSIAGNPSITKEILDKLAKDRNLGIRQQVANNPNT